MNFTSPVSSLMSSKLVTVAPGDPISMVKSIFDQQRIHHILVVRHKTLLGIISKSDYLQFVRNAQTTCTDSACSVESHPAYLNYPVEELMTTGIATLESTD